MFDLFPRQPSLSLTLNLNVNVKYVAITFDIQSQFVSIMFLDELLSRRPGWDRAQGHQEYQNHPVTSIEFTERVDRSLQIHLNCAPETRTW